MHTYLLSMLVHAHLPVVHVGAHQHALHADTISNHSTPPPCDHRRCRAAESLLNSLQMAYTSDNHLTFLTSALLPTSMFFMLENRPSRPAPPTAAAGAPAGAWLLPASEGGLWTCPAATPADAGPLGPPGEACSCWWRC